MFDREFTEADLRWVGSRLLLGNVDVLRVEGVPGSGVYFVEEFDGIPRRFRTLSDAHAFGVSYVLEQLAGGWRPPELVS